LLGADPGFDKTAPFPQADWRREMTKGLRDIGFPENSCAPGIEEFFLSVAAFLRSPETT